MFPSTIDHEINYRIHPQLKYVRLTMWESAPLHLQSVTPYLYVLNYIVKSVEDARQAVRDYLFVNGVATADELDIPHHGRIRVLPYPTWSNFEVCVEEVAISQAS